MRRHRLSAVRIPPSPWGSILLCRCGDLRKFPLTPGPAGVEVFACTRNRESGYLIENKPHFGGVVWNMTRSGKTRGAGLPRHTSSRS